MIKTKVIQTPKGRLLVVGGLPDGARNISVHEKQLWYDYFGYFGVLHDETTGDILPNGKWKLLGKLPDITEEQAKGVVDDPIKSPPFRPFGSVLTYPASYSYVDYKMGCWTEEIGTAKESLLSLVESEVPLKNKLGEYPTEESTGLEYGMEYLSKVDDWEEEQEKLFTNPVLFWEPQSKES